MTSRSGGSSIVTHPPTSPGSPTRNPTAQLPKSCEAHGQAGGIGPSVAAVLRGIHLPARVLASPGHELVPGCPIHNGHNLITTEE